VRPVPAPLAARLATGSSKLALAIEITTKTGAVYRFTEGDVAAVFGGHTFDPLPGLLCGTITYALDGSASSVDFQFGATADTPIAVGDIRDGFFDAAGASVWEYDLDYPEHGRVQALWVRVGDIVRRFEGGVKLNAKGILSQSHEIFVQHYTPVCIWSFCDDRCGLSPTTYTYGATITAISADRYTLTISGDAAARPDNVFLDGVATIGSGDRVGWNMAVRGNTGSTLLLHLAAPAALHVGDALGILQGCRKIWDATDGGTSCTFYNNRARFGGQPRAGSPEEAQNISYKSWSS
jgi:uncharacterized phage protein (TIGR02218 family)